MTKDRASPRVRSVARAARLKAALRDNLRRRKAAASPIDGPADPASPTADAAQETSPPPSLGGDSAPREEDADRTPR